MRDIRTDWHQPREGGSGPRLVVSCTAPACGRSVLMDPRPLFGTRRFWPVAGRSERFRCRCGGRETRLAYTANAVQRDGPVSADAIRLWT